ncbi:MAG: alanine--tRNA ligase [candidate division Zixibacteria bacterium]|nr:alanine--tRNA ligase [candidate division Zixibacteria bacterium]
MKAAEIRESFQQYFESRGHKRVASSSLIPLDDPTLLFTNAGMNQFKDIFLGQRKVPYNRATSSQKCIRAGGKHNDLENVGEDARHLTFFEMLGNFSFGDYFKEEAITFAWDYVHNILKLPPDRLYATVLTDDDEAFKLWGRIAPQLKSGRILRFGEKDNFWSMGETGPCGPDSELHFDRGAQYSCGKPTCGVNCECDRYMEIWNLVFMQFNRDTEGKLTPLPKPSVDTGAGLERIAMVMQKVDSNYDTDLFTPLLRTIEQMSGKEYFEDKRGTSHRVIADHIRALTFAIADGAMPSNEGRGYVLRRILRRASRHGRLLDMHEPFIYKLTATLVDIMGNSFPEIKQQAEHVALVIKSEEESFGETLDRGLHYYNEQARPLASGKNKVIPGGVVFMLHDTYGFPADLTATIAKDDGLIIDWAGYEEAMALQREKSKRRFHIGLMAIPANLHEHTDFVGYDDKFTTEAQIVTYSEAVFDCRLALVLDKTTFYAESGGQVGDAGEIRIGVRSLQVYSTVKAGDAHYHLISGETPSLSESDGTSVVAIVDGVRQKHVQRNHTATHLLHKALRTVLGDHVQQKGSLVDPDHLRFDFSHYKQLSEEELKEIERPVNEQILLNRKVKWENLPIGEAKARGAMALFGEKYGDTVRMVEIEDYSRELCGGTHVQATGEIGLFVITAESAIAAGIRRIEALTGKGALNYLSNLKNQFDYTARLLKQPQEKVVERIEELLEESKRLKKELDKSQAQSAASGIADLFKHKIKKIKGVTLLVNKFESKEQLNTYADVTQTITYPAIGVFFNDANQYAVTSSKPAIAMKLSARDIINHLNKRLSGRGGGREYFTQGGCDQPLTEQLLESWLTVRSRLRKEALMP